MLKKILLGGTSTLVLLAGVAHAADIDITTTGATNYTGSPAASSADFAADGTLNVAGTMNFATVTASGGDNIGTVNVNQNALFYTNAQNSGTSIIAADWGSATNGLKAVNFNSGTTHLDSNDYYVGQTTVNSGATLVICSGDGCPGATLADPGQVISGNLKIDGGTLDLGRTVAKMQAGPGSAAGDFVTTSGSVIKTTILGDGNTSGAGSYNLGVLKATGAVTLADGTTVVPVVNGITISDGARYILIDGSDVSATTVGQVTAQNSALVTWKVLRGDDASLGQDGKDVYLVATKKEIATLVSTPEAKGAATALTSIASSNAPGVQNLIAAISSLSTQAEVDRAVKQLAPSASVAAATTSGSAAATTANINTVNARAAEVRTAQAGGATGVATGDSLRGLGLWIQGLGFSGSQDQRKGQDGFDASTGGLAVGGDVQVAAPLRIGAAFSYARTNVDAKDNSSGSGVDIDSYQGTLYANYTGSPWYVDAALVYGRHQYDSTRAIGFLGAEAKGDYEGDQYTAQIAGGYPLAFGKTVVTPNASLAYSLLKQDAYEETGAPGANLSVEEQTNTSLRSGLGVKLAHTFQSGTNRIIPEGRATWFHEFRDDAPNQTARFSAGGSSFTTTGAKPAQDSAVLGVGLTVATADQVSVSANYDAELKDGYVGHNGTLQVRLDF
ncbi:MAG: autotransporter domain-containing protein [Magnetospirillum sp.]|nr:autotransporter domain-containing protein [Magnetospirillum sp.]